MAEMDGASVAVRNYLLYLDDPAQLVNQAEVERVERQLSSASDPLDKLRLLTELQQLRECDGEQLRADFCRHARRWAEANGISVQSFTSLGVDEATLRQAGMMSRSAATDSDERPGRVSVKTVKEAASRRTGSFTLADLAAETGASPMTIRKALATLIDGGAVTRIGPTPGWSQPGRAPILFTITATRDHPRHPAG